MTKLGALTGHGMRRKPVCYPEDVLGGAKRHIGARGGAVSAKFRPHGSVPQPGPDQRRSKANNTKYNDDYFVIISIAQ
ncbi:MAG TPA: hypothetical protein GX405_00360 [Rhizobiales bacterium]|nr:hypothetical protein [Hyphomicrobiales bacterium]